MREPIYIASGTSSSLTSNPFFLFSHTPQHKILLCGSECQFGIKIHMRTYIRIVEGPFQIKILIAFPPFVFFLVCSLKISTKKARKSMRFKMSSTFRRSKVVFFSCRLFQFFFFFRRFEVIRWQVSLWVVLDYSTHGMVPLLHGNNAIYCMTWTLREADGVEKQADWWLLRDLKVFEELQCCNFGVWNSQLLVDYWPIATIVFEMQQTHKVWACNLHQE